MRSLVPLYKQNFDSNNDASENKRSTAGAGARLSFQLLTQVFDWAGVKQPPVKLKAIDQTLASKNVDLFLQFMEGSNFARVGHGHGATFDLIPVRATGEKFVLSTKSPNARKLDKNFYALKYGEMWVAFNPLDKATPVTLSDKLRRACFFLICKPPGSGTNGEKLILAETMVGNTALFYQLKFQHEERRFGDVPLTMTSEVFMTERGDKSKVSMFDLFLIRDPHSAICVNHIVYRV